MNQLEGTVIAALIAGSVAFVTALITSRRTLESAEARLRREFQLEFAVERVAHELMRDSKWRLRSLGLIKHHLGGFDNDEDGLRRILLRAGAIRFRSKSGIELWGLLELNRERLGVVKISDDPQNPQLLLPEEA